MSCERRFDVGVYVLGALDPAQRSEFEQHLQTCAECGRELRLVGGLPGLLARVSEPGTGADEGSVPVPEGLLDRALTRARRARRLRVLVAAAAALVVLAGGVLVGRALPSTGTEPVRTVALRSVLDAPVRGEAGLAAKPWGTSISLRCQTYEGDAAPSDVARTVYVLLVRGADGSVEQVARWSPPPGQDVDVQAATNLPPGSVSGLQVLTGTGQVVLQG